MTSENTSVRTMLNTENQALECADYTKLRCSGGEEGDQKSRGEFFNAMGAISRGVEAQYEWFADFKFMVVERTIDVARKLSIPEEEIEGWASASVRCISGRNKTIENVLNRISHDERL